MGKNEQLAVQYGYYILANSVKCFKSSRSQGAICNRVEPNFTRLIEQWSTTIILVGREAWFST